MGSIKGGVTEVDVEDNWQLTPHTHLPLPHLSLSPPATNFTQAHPSTSWHKNGL